MYEFDSDYATDVNEIVGYHSDSYSSWESSDDYYDDCFLEALEDEDYEE